MVRQGLRSALQAYPNIQVVGEAGDGEEALTSAAKHHPAVIVMDINMPKMDGITTTRLIKAQNPEIVVIGISTGLEDYQIYAMQKAGAFEVLHKDVAVTDLYSAIQRGIAAVKPVLILEEPSTTKKSTEELEEAIKPFPVAPGPEKEEKI